MVQVKELHYQYTRGIAIAFPDIYLEKGEQLLLLGESGSGKTTLLHLLGGLLRTRGGSVTIAGKDLSTLSEAQLDQFRGKHVGFVFQKNHLISALTVRQNLMMAPYLSGANQPHERIEAVLSQLHLLEKRNSKIATLSQGQAQRVAIARAVINNPAVLIADEPTSALDDKNCERVIALLKAVARESASTLIVATHDQRLKSVFSKQLTLG